MFRVPAAIGLMLYWIASTAMAVGFDDHYVSTTVLGQPLDFSVVVNLGSAEWLSPECIDAEVIVGAYKVAHEHVHVRVDSGGKEGRATLRILTSVRIHEPVVTVQVTLHCTAQLSHQFVVFIDSRGAKFPATTGANASADLGRAAPRTVASVEQEFQRSIGREPPSAAVKRLHGDPRSDGVFPPRLMLVQAQQLTSAGLQPEAAATEQGVAADGADFDLRWRERDRLAQLEQSLERLRRRNDDAQQSIATLQVRLRESQAVRMNNALVYGLLALVALLLLAVAGLWRRQLIMSRQAAWSDRTLVKRDLAMNPLEFGKSALEFADDPLVPRGPVAVEPTPALDPDKEPAIQAMSMPRQLSVEELIDLEQQADFFVALGQDEAAIDLLMGHVRSSGGASPMPYLKLLDIYRRRGERDAYERIRERFNRRFNAYAAEFEIDPRDGRALEDYSVVMSRLQAAWPDPLQAMGVLEALLFTRDSSDQPFDSPAFGELLFLYSHARDLAEREAERRGVDVLLPLATSNAPPLMEAAWPSPLPAQAQADSASASSVEHIDLNVDASADLR